MTDFISSVQVFQSFTDVVSASGLNSNLPIIAFNIVPEQIRYTVSALQPIASSENQSHT